MSSEGLCQLGVKIDSDYCAEVAKSFPSLEDACEIVCFIFILKNKLVDWRGF